MRHFNYDGEEEFDDIDKLFGDDLEGYDDLNEEIINILEFDLVEYDLNRKLLILSLQIAQGSFLWRFYGIKRKLTIIHEVYEKLIFMVEKGSIVEDLEEEKDEDADL